VVMFIWRPDADNIEQVKLDIQKHRNGPTGEIDVTFKPERVKFYGTEKQRIVKGSKKAENTEVETASLIE